MPSSRRLRIAREAQDDIDDILQDSLEQWGELQSQAYARKMSAALERIASFPAIGTAREEFGTGIRVVPIGSQLAVYRTDDEAVTIVRVIHQRRDIGNALSTRP